MGIIFGSAIVYIVSRLVAAQRRIACLEQHVTKKADEELVDGLSAKITSVQADTQKTLANLAEKLESALQPEPVFESEPLPERMETHSFPEFGERPEVNSVIFPEPDVDACLDVEPCTLPGPDAEPRTLPDVVCLDADRALPEPDVDACLDAEPRTLPDVVCLDADRALPEPDVDVCLDAEPRTLPEPDVEAEVCSQPKVEEVDLPPPDTESKPVVTSKPKRGRRRKS
jgi:hypothetical protein